MSDTTNTNNSTSPQDLINAALGTTTPTPAQELSTEPQLTPELPLTPTPTIETPVMPSELTEAPVLPTQVTMGDDTPLAFVGSAPAATTPTTEPVVEPTMPVSLGTSAPMDAVPPVVPIATLPVEPIKTQKKSKVLLFVLGFFALVGLLGAFGYGAYNKYGTINPAQISVVAGKTQYTCGGCEGNNKLVWKNGECVWSGKACDQGNGDTTSGNQSECTGCKNGFEVKWSASKNSCVQVQPCKLGEINSSSTCGTSGGLWCKVTDSAGKNHEFCGDNTSGRACYKQAIEDKGITMSIGMLKCKQSGDSWVLDETYYTGNTAGSQTVAEVMASYNAINGTSGVDPCSKTYTPKAGTEKYVCKIGVVGQGTEGQPGVAYTGGACTALNGKVFYGNEKGCFCGTVQVDTPHGHQSYSSTCGCDKTVDNPSPIPSPSVPVTAPKLMCDGLTRTPTTTPVIGDKLTFTCTGSSVPAGSVALTYKFRSAIDGGVWSSLTNKTATTAEMTINACGSYKIQCQACGTISGAVVCDPVWTGATAL